MKRILPVCIVLSLVLFIFCILLLSYEENGDIEENCILVNDKVSVMNSDYAKKDNRFVIKYNQMLNKVGRIVIVEDLETKESYLIIGSNRYPIKIKGVN